MTYCPETGDFTCNYTQRKMGGVSDQRYIKIGVDARSYYAHRLAFLYMLGEIPKEVDHINSDKRDNRWSNLRECTRAQNVINMGVTKNSTTGYTGVSRNRHKYRAYIVKDNAQIHLGVADTPEEAALMYNAAAQEMYGEYATLNEIKER